MSRRYDCADASERAAGLAAAAAAVSRGELVVLPTDTVYGVGADAFNPVAVTCLLAAKGRGRNMPPPVLVGSVRAAVALVDDLGPFGKDFVEEFWPGGLTLICHATPTLHWDLGDTRGTVAVRMPLQPVALDLLRETGPLAVSSANLTGSPAATSAAEAESQLGDAVSVYLDDGPCVADVASTIVDMTGPVPRLLRRGVIPVRRLREVVAEVRGLETALAGQALDFALLVVPPDGAGEAAPLLPFVAGALAARREDGEARWTSVAWGLPPGAPGEEEALSALLALGAAAGAGEVCGMGGEVIASPQPLPAGWSPIEPFPRPAAVAAEPRAEAVGYYPRPSLRVEYAAPRNELEQSIAEVWRGLLGVAQVGIYDSFLDLGGDSLLASRMVTRLREIVRLEVPVRQVFETPTVADLATAVERLRAEAEEREMKELLAQIQGMSDEDLEQEIMRREDVLRGEESR